MVRIGFDSRRMIHAVVGAASLTLAVAALAQPPDGPIEPSRDRPRKQTQPQASQRALGQPASLKPRYIPNRLIVKFRTSGPNSVTLPPADVGRRKGPTTPGEREKSDRYRSLFQLNEQLKVKSATELAPRDAAPAHQSLEARAAVEGEGAGTRAVDARFPKRSRRAGTAKAVAPRLTGYFVLEFEPGGDMEAYRKRYLANPFVEAVYLDVLIPLDLAPDDPFFATKGAWSQEEDDLWGLKRMRADAAWDVSQGEGIVVAVLDSGVDYEHKDIQRNIWANPKEVPGNGVDDDGNGFIDDVRGWDFWSNDADPRDEQGHGTHVAGTIAAEGNNGLGVIGVAPKAKIMVLKGGGSEPEVSLAAMTRAFLYAVDNGADVASCSWGPSASSLTFSPLLEEIIRYARRSGVAVVFASGNNGSFMTHSSPRTMREVLAVGASLPDDGLAVFSNTGPRLGVVAPGGGAADAPNRGVNNILSLKAAVVKDQHPLTPFVVKDDYLRLAGTSMATPHVSGLVALVLSKRPGFTLDEAFSAIAASCDDVGEPGFDLQTGFGRVNAQAALALEQPLTVRITSPSDNATLPVSGATSVFGVVSGAKLREWRLAYSPLSNLAQVQSIGGTETTPREGLLQSWDPTTLPTGPYLLRLIATDQHGRVYQDVATVGRSIAPAAVVARGDRLRWNGAMSGGRLAWLEASPLSAEVEIESSLEIADFAGGGRRRLADFSPGFATRLDLDGDWVVHDLQTPTSSGVEVAYVLRNLATNSVESLAKFPAGHPWPQVALSGGRVYWTDDSDTLFARDLTPGAEPRSLDQRVFDGLKADQERVVWTDSIDVFVMEGSTGEVRQISQDRSPVSGALTGFFNVGPSIDGDRVAWRRSKDDRTSAVMAHNLSTGQTQLVARNLPNVRGVVVSGPRVFWDDLRLAQQDVSFALLTASNQGLVTGEMSNQFVVAAEGSKAAIVSHRRAQVGDGGVAVYDLSVVDVSTPPMLRGVARRQDGVDFTTTTSSDGRAATLIFDNFQCELAARGEALVAKRELSLALPFRDEQAGANARVVLRGGVSPLPTGAAATAMLVVGGKPAAFELTGGGEFVKELTVRLPQGANLTTSVWIVLDQPTPRSAGGFLEIHSLDVEIEPES